MHDEPTGHSTKKKRIYIAGPMRGIKDFNFPAFDVARDTAIALGYEVVSPADLDRLYGFEGIGKNGTDAEWVSDMEVEDVVERDVRAILRCDAIALMNGWSRSTGAKAELVVAQWAKKEILDATNFLPYEGPPTDGGADLVFHDDDKGKKYDDGKPRYDLVAPDAHAGLVDVLTFGSRKYAARNWERGIAFGRVFAATLRHLYKWWSGEDNDPETGISHLDHAACNIHFLSAFTKRRMDAFDDRPKQAKTIYEIKTRVSEK